MEKFNPQKRGIRLLRNVGNCLPNYMAQNHTRMTPEKQTNFCTPLSPSQHTTLPIYLLKSKTKYTKEKKNKKL
jgi:hypothetical protein